MSEHIEDVLDGIEAMREELDIERSEAAYEAGKRVAHLPD